MAQLQTEIVKKRQQLEDAAKEAESLDKERIKTEVIDLSLH